MLKQTGLLGELLGGTDPPALADKAQTADKMRRAATLLEQGVGSPLLPLVWKQAAGEVIEGLRDGADSLEQENTLGDAFVFTSLGGAHDLFKTDLTPVPLWPQKNLTAMPDVIFSALDGGFLPDTDTEGVARVQVIGGWTVTSFHDRSTDRRMGSHSTFVLSGVYPAEAGIAKAQELFPTLFQRYTFDVVLQV